MKKLKLLLLGLSFTCILALPMPALADVNDFTVTSFTADETLTRKDRQGELHIVERIKVDFTDNNHGILRAIPKSYKHHSLQLKILKVSSPSGAPAGYTTYDSNGNTVLKIGSADKTVTGPQEYVIDYTLRNVISFYKDHDELYWDVNGDQWQQPFGQVSVTLHLPAGLRQTNQPACYAASYNSTSQDCIISTSGNTLRATTTQPLAASQTLTYVAGFEKGYFEPSKWNETFSEYSKPIIGLIVPILLLGGGSFLLWLRRGRDPKGSSVIVPQYEAPDGLKPLDVGTLVDFRVDSRDITAVIIDLSIRGYIKIIETKKDRLIGKDKLNYQLELLNNDFSKLDSDESLLLDEFFGNRSAGSKIQLENSQSRLYGVAAKLRKSSKQRLTDNGYFRRNFLFATLSLGQVFKRTTVMMLDSKPFYLVIIIGLCTAGVIGGTWFVVGLIIGLLISAPFLIALNARTVKGVIAREHILGLKRYLEVAEKQRIEKLQAPGAEYASNAAEPVKTVELFEKLLPYAMVLGVEKQWAEQFKDLYTAPPDWYGGNWSTFSAVYLVSSLNSGVSTAVNAAFGAPGSSSGSGFGGGGFSGGGGGGGGGGGW